MAKSAATSKLEHASRSWKENLQAQTSLQATAALAGTTCPQPHAKPWVTANPRAPQSSRPCCTLSQCPKTLSSRSRVLLPETPLSAWSCLLTKRSQRASFPHHCLFCLLESSRWLDEPPAGTWWTFKPSRSFPELSIPESDTKVLSLPGPKQ